MHLNNRQAIKTGITLFIENLDQEDWTTRYPKGQGMAGGFYIHYHSYRYIFPLLAFAHYQRKFSANHLDIPVRY